MSLVQLMKVHLPFSCSTLDCKVSFSCPQELIAICSSGKYTTRVTKRARIPRPFPDFSQAFVYLQILIHSLFFCLTTSVYLLRLLLLFSHSKVFFYSIFKGKCLEKLIRNLLNPLKGRLAKLFDYSLIRNVCIKKTLSVFLRRTKILSKRKNIQDRWAF